MNNYIDGFAFPIAANQIDEYKRVAARVAEIYREHGATEYREFVGDDMRREGTAAFPDLLSAKKGETIVFGWIVYDSREKRDLVNKKVETDPRIAKLVAPIMNPEDQVFDPARMAFGGFQSLVKQATDHAN